MHDGSAEKKDSAMLAARVRAQSLSIVKKDHNRADEQACCHQAESPSSRSACPLAAEEPSAHALHAPSRRASNKL